MLYLGDSRIRLKKFIGAVDCIITDPPYQLTKGGKGKYLGGKFSQEKYNNDGLIIKNQLTWNDIMLLCYNLLKDQSHAYVMTNNRNMFEAYQEALNVGFRYHNTLVWKKGNQKIKNGWYMGQVEFALFLFKGKAKRINDQGTSNLFDVASPKNSQHPTQKPIELLKQWVINSTNEGDLICDPFAGVATTGVATKIEGRKFIGCEIDENYFNIGKENLKNFKKF